MPFYKIVNTIIISLTSLFSIFAYAEYSLYFINNTTNPIHYSSKINSSISGCSDLASGSYQAFSGTVAPYARAHVFQVNYDQGIKNGLLYCLDTTYTSEDGKDSFTTRMQLHGDFIGSSIYNIRYYANNDQQALFEHKPQPNNVQLNKITPKNLWLGKPVTLRAAAIHYGESDQSTNEIDLVLDDNAMNTRFSRDDNDVKSLAVASYNVQLWPIYAAIASMRLNEPTERSELIPHYLKNYDVVSVQELMDNSLRQQFISGMQQEYPYYQGPTGVDKPIPALSGGEMVFSHWPILKTDQMIYQNHNGIDSQSSKGVVYIQIQKGSQIYNIFASHTQATEGASTAAGDSKARIAQFAELRNFIAKQSIPKDQPVILAGDLNVEFQACYKEGHCDEYNQTIKPFNPDYKPWINMNILPYGGDYTKNLMNTGDSGEMDDYILYLSNYLHPTTDPQTRIRVVRNLDDPTMYDGGDLKDPYAELDLSDHFMFEGQFHF